MKFLFKMGKDFARSSFMTTAMWISNNHISENLSVFLLVLLTVRCCDSFLRITKCSVFLLGEKITHPQHCPEAGKVPTGSTSSMKYPSIVNTLPLQFMRDYKSSLNSTDHTVFSITCQMSWEGMPVSWLPAMEKEAEVQSCENIFIRNIQELIRKARNPDFQAILYPTLGLVSQAPSNIEDREREGKKRQGKEVYSRCLKISLEPVFWPSSELTSNSVRPSKRCPKCY